MNSYGMDFSNLVYKDPNDALRIPYRDMSLKDVVMLSNGCIQIPYHDGYYYDFYTNKVMSLKKGRKFQPSFRYMKMYTDKNGNQYVNLLRSTDNCRHDHYIHQIVKDIYEINKPMGIPTPGIIISDYCILPSL